MTPEGQVSIFDSTSALAGQAAAKVSGSRRKRILDCLSKGDKTIFETADELGLFDHQISGRFREMERDGVIEKSGERRTNPKTGCACEVYRLRDSHPFNGRADLSRAQSREGPRSSERALAAAYPPTLVIEDERFNLEQPLDVENTPGMPYSRSVDPSTGSGQAIGGTRLNYRVSLIECEGCGRTVKLVEDPSTGSGQGGQGKRKTWRCGTPGCNRVWHLLIVREPGGASVLAMVMKTL